MSPVAPTEFIMKSIWILLAVFLLFIIYYLVNIGNRFVEREKRIDISNKNIGLVVAILIGLYILSRLFKKFGFLGDLASTIFLSIILAYALNPVINYFEDKGINRTKGVLIVYLIIVVVIIILGVSVIPKSIREIKKLANNFPSYATQLTTIIETISSKITSIIGDAPVLQGLEDSFIETINSLEGVVGNSLKGFLTGIINVASKAVSVVLTPILTLYFLVDKEIFKEKLVGIIPDRYRMDILDLAERIDTSLILFIRGRLIMSVYIAIATTIMLLILRIEFAFVIGFITGLFDIVPYIGPFIGYLPAVFFALLSSPMKALWVSLFFVLIQWVENNILGPKVLGENMGLHPMTILLSIIVGGGIFGVFGMILSVPVVATVKIVYDFFRERNRDKKLDSV